MNVSNLCPAVKRLFHVSLFSFLLSNRTRRRAREECRSKNLGFVSATCWPLGRGFYSRIELIRTDRISLNSPGKRIAHHEKVRLSHKRIIGRAERPA